MEKQQVIKTASPDKLPICKAKNEELKQATFVVLVPDEVDLHSDVISEEEVRKACFNFNMNCMKANLFHLVETKTFDFCESYICPIDMMLGERFIKKGTWLATVQCHSDELWEEIKSENITGLSIGAKALVEELDD